MAFGSFDNKSSGSAVSEINMVPLIDVMLVLLVIFIITAPLLSHSLQIDLPQARGEPVEQEPVVVDLAINAQGTLFWNEVPVDLVMLRTELTQAALQDPQPSIRIRADHDTRYDVLASVMSEARQAGIKRLGFITRPDQASMSGAAAKARSAEGGGAASSPEPSAATRP